MLPLLLCKETSVSLHEASQPECCWYAVCLPIAQDVGATLTTYLLIFLSLHSFSTVYIDMSPSPKETSLFSKQIKNKATSLSKLQFSLLKMDVDKTLMNSDTALRFLKGFEDFHCQTWLLCYENDSQLKGWENILKDSSTVLKKAGYPGTLGEKLLTKLVRWGGTTFECHNNFIA